MQILAGLQRLGLDSLALKLKEKISHNLGTFRSSAVKHSFNNSGKSIWHQGGISLVSGLFYHQRSEISPHLDFQGEEMQNAADMRRY